LIKQFDADDKKVPGRTLRGIDLTVKDSLDLPISRLEEYKTFDSVLFESLSKYLSFYVNDCFFPCRHESKGLIDTGYQIQKTSPGSVGYTWHHDFILFNSYSPRILTFIWYLNTVEEGGETEFITGEKIKPEQGKLLMFPATWSMGHRGLPPISGEKYICTGWFIQDFANI
jgi:hypothetical protein